MAKEPSQKPKGGKGSDRLDLTPDTVTQALGAAELGDRRRSPVIFAGLLADDDDPQLVRLYQDYELRTFLCIQRSDILNREGTRNLAGTEVSILWVDKGAEIEICEISSEQVQADMLSQALAAAEAGGFQSAESQLAFTTPATPTIPVATALICTKVFCTNITCACTSRHSLLCSITCTRHITCPNPWTKNWFC